MKTRFLTPLLLLAITLGCAKNETLEYYGHAATPTSPIAETSSETMKPLRTLEEFQQIASRYRAVLELPTFETSPAQLERTVDQAISRADASLTELAGQNLDRVTFESAMVRLDGVVWTISQAANRIGLIKETSTSAEVRAAATEQIKRLNDWFVAIDYRQDVYKACKAFETAYNAGRRPTLRNEDLKLFSETMRDYRRAGLDLALEQRQRVEALRKQLANLNTDFDTNITNASVAVTFTADELEGVSDEWLERTRTDDGDYVFHATVTPEFMAIMQSASSEKTRKKMKIQRYSVAQDVNTPILNEMVRLRDEIARALGYDSWADYKIEPKMAKTAKTAMDFENRLVTGLEPKFRDEVAAMTKLKVAETGDPGAHINMWDWRYYTNQVKKQNFSVDEEALRVFFPYERSLKGMFGVYESIFGLRFDQIKPPYKWFDDVTLYVVSDSSTNEPLGMFFLDMFPRQGKYNHFAEFGIIDGRRLENGRYRRPVVSLVCNFTPATGTTPSLMSHSELETLFHEFGHAMHAIMTRAKYGRFSGTSVPRDFVEAPSQMLENWTWSADVLNRFAADYRDPSKKIDPAVLAKMKEAKLATAGTFYRRQLAFGVADLRLHAPGSYKDTQEIVNDALGDIFFPAPEGTNFAAYWGHLAGYDAGYYGYAWADAIAADMATRFEQAPNHYLDKTIGRKLRDEVYATGGSRDVEDSVRAFLGRERSIEPFLRSIGIHD